MVKRDGDAGVFKPEQPPLMESFYDHPSTSNIMLRPSFDLSSLHEILDGGDDEEISRLIVIFQGSYLDLMADSTLSNVFEKLVDHCRSGHLFDSVVAEVLSDIHLFTNAAFFKYGYFLLLLLLLFNCTCIIYFNLL